jgi:predicted short-subunit dehydrogenase-like oxidoreductase (DUF2520 family)
MNVVIVGTGNVAYALGEKICKSEHDLLQVAGRNALAAEKIGRHLQVAFTGSLANLERKADLYIIAISDASLQTVGDWLQLEKKLVVHTAGSVSIEVLKKVSTNYGVLYPLQSFRSGMKLPEEIPFVVDGNTADDLTLIKDFASSLSSRIEVADDLTRKKIHLAAVFVNNFSNHLYALAEKYCEAESLPFDLLLPLIFQTAERIRQSRAKDSQTGPALRNDEATISNHIQLLKDYPKLKKIYEMMTEDIREFHEK